MDQLTARQSDTANLEHEYQVVDQLSTRLTDSYEQLQQQVARLTRELSETRQRHIRELRDKERLANRLYRVLEALPAAVIVIDDRDRIDQFNPIAEILFPDIRWGRLWHEVFGEQVSSQTANNEFKLKDGRCISVSRQSLSPDPGKIVVVIDVTDSRALQEQLNRQQRLAEMGEMAAQLAHQIRTPVASALLYSEHLGRHDLRKDQRERFSESLCQSLRHTENQVKDLLTFARGGHFEPATVNLSNLVGEVEDNVEPILQDAGATLNVVDQTDGKAFVKGNNDALAGALANLIENATRHGGESVAVDLILTRVEDGYCIRIEDDGVGIAEDIRHEIFNPFFTTSSSGTGLGLAVVQNVILAHGGAILLLQDEKREHESGAGFVICLPDMTEQDETGLEKSHD
ncbi:MAG: histidine kinase [Gammaproteobacteria bacterium]|nr:histidine kinase [Gammaproteobacteria bacterium]